MKKCSKCGKLYKIKKEHKCSSKRQKLELDSIYNYNSTITVGAAVVLRPISNNNTNRIPAPQETSDPPTLDELVNGYDYLGNVIVTHADSEVVQNAFHFVGEIHQEMQANLMVPTVNAVVQQLTGNIGAPGILLDIKNKIEALDKKIDEKIGALDKKIDEKVGALDKKIEALDQKVNSKLDRKYGLLRKDIYNLHCFIRNGIATTVTDSVYLPHLDTPYVGALPARIADVFQLTLEEVNNFNQLYGIVVPAGGNPRAYLNKYLGIRFLEND